MKWAFFDRLKVYKNRAIEKPDAKKTRRRYNKARLLDLLCTLRTRSIAADATSCLSLSSTTDTHFGRTSNSTTSLSELVHYHSLVLRHPIPIASLPPFHKRDSKLECCTSQPAYCPTCRNVIILLPQKRRSRTEDFETTCTQPRDAKRVRTCLNELELAHLRWQVSNAARGEVVDRGYYNPTFEPHHPDTSSCVYSDVYDTACSDDTSIASVSDRPKLVGVRRHNRSVYRGSDQSRLKDWLLANEYDNAKLEDTTYATVYASNLSLDQKVKLGNPGEPWSSSTLKRRCKPPLQDDMETVYDDVASEMFDSFDWSANPPPTRPRLAVRRRLSDSPDHPIDQVKRVRREYFVCEE